MVKEAVASNAAREKYGLIFRQLTEQAVEAMTTNNVTIPNRKEIKRGFVTRWKAECNRAQLDGVQLKSEAMAKWFDSLEKQIEAQKLFRGPVSAEALEKIGFRKRGKRMCASEMQIELIGNDVRIVIDRRMQGLTMNDITKIGQAIRVGQFTPPTKTRSWP